MNLAANSIGFSKSPASKTPPFGPHVPQPVRPMRPSAAGDLVSQVTFALADAGRTATMHDYRPGELIYRQGDECSDVLFVKSGVVKYCVLAKSGHEAVLALYGPGALLGEACLAGQRDRTGSAIAIDHSSVLAVAADLLRMLMLSRPALAVQILGHLMQRNMRTEEGLLDQMFNTSEKRLARVLLMLARESAQGPSKNLVPNISQSTLAQMVGTTRSRVNASLNRFRKHGFIDYDSNRRLRVTNGLRLVLEDQ